MKFLNLILLLLLISCKGQSSENKQNNLKRITQSYIDFKKSIRKFDLENDVILVGANSIDKNSYWLDIVFDNSYTLSGMDYKDLYQIDGLKVIIFKDLDKSQLLEKLFDKIPYENLNKAKYSMTYDLVPFHTELNNKNEILSIKSKYPIKDILPFLKKNKVKFSKDYQE
ncbi:hypothetical protein [Chryseobacterium pennipullorum]|uniref:Lipoprotein n=1 Tax=Chryseobacterium pennipullorum TaxID=2258963 RepID=A0A3D9AKG1_9FLAO|nr:hypothetical protein [Chryseobacterium pennipullorum]REC41834.1 hypothetical protein DRF67_21045 [Chryseobacterium pennipullorum]